MGSFMDLLKKIKDIMVKYPWTSIIFAVIILVAAILYVFFPDTFDSVYKVIVDIYNALFGGEKAA